MQRVFPVAELWRSVRRIAGQLALENPTYAGRQIYSVGQNLSLQIVRMLLCRDVNSMELYIVHFALLVYARLRTVRKLKLGCNIETLSRVDLQLRMDYFLGGLIRARYL